MNAPFTPPTMSCVDFLLAAARYFEQRPEEKFTAARGLEFLKIDEFNAAHTAGATIFTTLETVAHQIGLITDGTFGGLTKCAGIHQGHAHKLGCACRGEVICGAEVANRIHELIAEL